MAAAKKSREPTSALKKSKAVKKKTKIAAASMTALQKTKQSGLTEFGRARRTTNAYTRYVDRGRDFLAEIIAQRRDAGEGETCEQGIKTAVLAKAFENPPNMYSATALELYLVQKCFTENLGKSTAQGIHAAFADYWDNM
jgi:hypothetical protein